MYGTKYFSEDVCLTNDIDMLLFNKEYIEKNLESIDDEDLVILNSDAYDPKRPECVGIFSGPDRYPICYIAAKGKIFDKLLGTNITFREYVKKIESFGVPGHNDELYFGKIANENKTINIHRIKRGYCTNFYAPQRIEKDSFEKKNQSQFFKLNVNGFIDISQFIDCHCLPYKENEEIINKIKNLILG